MKKIIIIFIATVLLSGISYSNNILSRDEFIKAAVKNNPRYQVSVSEYLAALQENKAAHSIEDWNLVASATYFESKPAAISPLNPEYQNVLSYSVGVEKYFLPTGTGISIEHNNAKTRSTYSSLISGFGFPTAPYYLSDVSVSISQPLLKDAFGLASKLGLKISDYALRLAEIKLGEDWEDFIGSLSDDYLTWQQYYLTVRVEEKQLKKLKAQLNLILRQRRYGLSEDLDVVQTRQQESAFQLSLEQAKLNYKNQSRKIYLLMGKDTSLQSLQMSPEKLTESNLDIGETAALQYLNSNSNINRTAELMVTMQRNTLKIKENAELPELNLVLQARPNAYENGFSDSLGRIGENNEYSIVVSASRGLFNDLAGSEKKKASEDYKKALAEKNKILLDSKITLESLYQTMSSMDRLIELSKNNLKLAKQRLNLEERRLNQGRNSIFFVLQAESALLAAENSFNNTLIAREKTLNSINSIIDRYLVKYKDLLKFKEQKNG